MSDTTSAVPKGCTYPNCQTSAGCHGECERQQRRAMFAADKPPMTTPPDDLSKLAEQITKAIREIPTQNPAYISVVPQDLGRMLDGALLRVIAKVAATEAATAIRSLTEEVDAAKQETERWKEGWSEMWAKLSDGTLHAGHCNADHRGPVGGDGCSCHLGRVIKSLRHDNAAPA